MEANNIQQVPIAISSNAPWAPPTVKVTSPIRKTTTAKILIGDPPVTSRIA